MALSRSQQFIFEVQSEIVGNAQKLALALANQPDFTTTPPALCPSNVDEAENDAQLICHLQARLDYLLQVLVCAGSANPVQCMNDACAAYDDASETCQSL